jgi:1,6-anhydro-N-acetylmuramate kinase
MGANAATSIPDFVAVQILTAAELKVVNCGIPVFADARARDAAFGGSGEKTLAEGQYAYLEAPTKPSLRRFSWQTVGVAGLRLFKPKQPLQGYTFKFRTFLHRIHKSI